MSEAKTLAALAKKVAFRDIDNDNNLENKRLGLKYPFKRVNFIFREKDICEFYGIKRDFRVFNGGWKRKEK